MGKTDRKNSKRTQSKGSPIIGIDLGTTYSCVAVWQAAQERVEIIANDMGNRTTPSSVAFTESERLIGEAAKNQAASNPANTLFDIKRLIGRNFADQEVQTDMNHWPFKVVDGGTGKPAVQVMYENKKCQFEPEAISAMVLEKMKAAAEAYLDCEVKRAVITVPAYFNDSQRQATKDAGQIAGLEVLRIINEPTAAALAYGLQKKDEMAGEQHILVFDLGGGTFDVSLLSLDEGIFTVKATAGNTHLGGDDFDKCLVKYCQDQFKKKYKKDISTNKRAISRILTACERAKRTLSVASQTTIEVDSLSDGIDFSINVRAAQFEELCSPLFSAIIGPVEQVLSDAGLDESKIDEIVLVGGSTRIPKVRKMLSEFFDGKALNMSVNADEAVAYGAAIQGAILSGSQSTAIAEIVLLDVTPLSLGIAVEGRIHRQGGTDDQQDGRKMKILIPRNTTVPTSITDKFTTHADNQREVQIEVYQGERPKVRENHFLGKFRLGGLTPARAGKLRIDVTLAVDANGILTVSAKETGTSKGVKTMTIRSENQRLTSSQIQRMLEEAERFKEQDLAFAARLAAINDLEEYIWSMRSRLRGSAGSNLSATDHRTTEDALDEQNAWLTDNEDCPAVEYEERKRELEDLLEPIWSAAEETEQDETEEEDSQPDSDDD